MQSLTVALPLVFLASLALAIVLPLVVGRLVPDRIREANLRSSLAVSSSITAPFMIFLGFMIVVLWGQMNDASSAVQQEVDALANVDALVDQMDPVVAQRLRGDIRAYVTEAIAEWDALAEGHPTIAARRAFITVRNEVLGLAANPAGSEILEGRAVDQVLEAQTYRSERMTAASADIPAALWIALFVGTLLYVAYIVITDTGPLVSRIAMSFIALSVIGLSLILVSLFDNPYRGDIRASPQPFVDLLARLATDR